MSSASTGSMRSKWLKAFKSLKTPPSSTSGGGGGGSNAAPTIRETERKNNGAGVGGGGAAAELPPGVHQFQEYTYKKITPCDICSQVLRGHTRQGLKCRVCKLNVHVDCQEKALGAKCQAKSRLLRRQKSTSEIETVASGHQHHAAEDEKAEVTQSEASSSTSSSRRRRIFAGMRSLSVFQQSSGGSGSNSPKTAPGSPLKKGFFHSGGSSTPQGTQRQRTSSRHSHARSISLPETDEPPEEGAAAAGPAPPAGVTSERRSNRSSSGRRPASNPASHPDPTPDPLAARSRPFGQPLFLTTEIPDENA